MALKRQGNSRDDKSARSPKRPAKSDSGRSSASSSRGKNAKSDSPDKESPFKKFEKGNSTRKPTGKSYSGRADKAGDRPSRSFDKEGGDRKPYSSTGSKPYSGRPDRSSSDRPSRSFDKEGGDRKPYSSTGSKPYSGRPDRGSSDRPPRSFDKEGGDRKPYSSTGSKPYSGRADRGSSDRPPRSFDKEGGDRKPYSSAGSKPYSGRPDRGTSDRPPRSFDKEGGDRKPYSSTGSKPYSGRSADSDAPKKSFDKPGYKPRTEGGFKKRATDSFRDKPTRTYGDRPERSFDDTNSDAPERTMRGRKNPAEPKAKDSGLIRLNRYIANAGICSRRKADELIEAGVVSVNGVVISELGHKVDPAKDEIRYNGETLKREKNVYVLLNKPKDYITTTEDPQERRTVMHLVDKASKERIYPVGRLDRNTTGLILMTNDGDLADKLSHPRSNIVKLYQVELSKGLSQGDMNKIGFGIELEDGIIKPDSVSYVAGGTKREIGIQIHSGKNRIVRRIFEHLGYEVVKLDRVVYAGLTKKDLPRGRWRYLEEKEIIQLKHLI